MIIVNHKNFKWCYKIYKYYVYKECEILNKVFTFVSRCYRDLKKNWIFIWNIPMY